jgi:muramoyltetrapeptide carboxypeptidase
LEERHGPPPPKLLVGFSDATALHAYVRRHWNWSSLHAAMPATADFGRDPAQWAATADAVCGGGGGFPREGKSLSFLSPAPVSPIDGELVGGTLSVLAAMAGTPDFPDTRGKILFFEDVHEA